MFLACDIGNSRIKYALFKDDALVEFRTFKDPGSFFKNIKNKRFESAGISSVVPSMNKAFSGEIKKISGVKPDIVGKAFPFSFKLNYQTLNTLGIDRICSAEGAFQITKAKFPDYIKKKKGCILVIDFGTATTMNVLELPGAFIGGMILPGIEMMFNSLKKNTDKLPLISVNDYKNFIGTGTGSSIASGVINSNTALIRMLREFLKKKSKGKIKTFITGGNAEKIIPFCNFDFIYEKALVLIGINSVCGKLERKSIF